jgi:hypothetical protein
MNSDWSDYRHNIKFQNMYLKFITPLTQSIEKTVNIFNVLKYVYKPRNVSVLFSQCGEWHGSASHQKWLWRALRSTVCMLENDIEEDGNGSSECEEVESTDCEDGDIGTNW